MKRVKIFLLLFTLCCALTACGTKPADDVPPPDDETSAVDIEWFNTEFFNHDTDVDGVVRANPHNQFLTCLYNVPQEINLYDLFYDGGGVREAPSQEELEQLGVLAEDGSQICPTD